MGKSVGELGVEELVNAGGLRVEEGNELYHALRDILSEFQSPSHIWRQIVTRRLLKPSYPHSLHQLLYYSVYHSQHSSLPLYCFPSLYVSLLLCLSPLFFFFLSFYHIIYMMSCALIHVSEINPNAPT